MTGTPEIKKRLVHVILKSILYIYKLIFSYLLNNVFDADNKPKTKIKFQPSFKQLLYIPRQP